MPDIQSVIIVTHSCSDARPSSSSPNWSATNGSADDERGGVGRDAEEVAHDEHHVVELALVLDLLLKREDVVREGRVVHRAVAERRCMGGLVVSDWGGSRAQRRGG